MNFIKLPFVKTRGVDGGFWPGITNWPIKIRLIVLFLPITILAVLITAIFSYHNAKSQLEANARIQLDDTVHQTAFLANDKFKSALEQLVAIENHPSYKSLLQSKLDRDENVAKYESIISINNLFREIYSQNFEMLDSIYLNVNNAEFTLLKKYLPVRAPIDIDQWMARNHFPKGGYHWKMVHVDPIFRTNQPRRVFSVYRLLGGVDSPLKSLLLLNIDAGYILDMLANVKISANGYMMLVNGEGCALSKPVSRQFRLNRNALAFLQENSGNRGSFDGYSLTRRKMFVVFTTIRINGWVIAAVVPQGDILVNLSYIRYMILMVVIGLLIVSTFLATVVADGISRPLSFLSAQVKRFEKGDNGVDFRVDDRGEIGVLANGLSSLRANVVALLEKIKAEEEAKKQLELNALQEQMNPHFIYNTLSSIIVLVDMGQNDKASRMLSALTNFLMIGLSNGKEIISVKEELQHVSNYLFIQKMRYTKDFDFEISVDEDIANCKIMKLTLQPLVENAIYHGLRAGEEFGYIRINGSRSGNWAVLEVFDNGVGIPPAQLAELQRSIRKRNAEEADKAFGLRNVNQRLILHFGPEYGLEIESEVGKYTLIRVKIPFA